jgi:putative peptide zinc metalloprotease protein
VTSVVEPSVLRAVPVRNPDAELHFRNEGAVRTPILKHSGKGRYHQLSQGKAAVWLLCDGKRTVGAIAELAESRGGPENGAKAVSAVLALAADGLVEGVPKPALLSPPENAAARFVSVFRELLTWRVTKRCVDGSVARIYRRIAWFVFTTPAYIVLATTIVSGFIVFGDEVLTRPSPFHAMSFRWAWILPFCLFACQLPHELAHAMVTKHCRREIIGIGLGWFWFGPILYVDTSDMWLAGRHARIAVGAAGLVVDLFMAAVCGIVSLWLPPSLSNPAFAVAAALYVRILLNLSPMLEYDGYYILTDILNYPNLRKRAFQKVDFMRIIMKCDIWEIRRNKTEYIYVILSYIYICFLVITDTTFNYKILSGLFEANAGGWGLAVTCLVTLLLFLIFSLGLASDIWNLRRSANRQESS